MRKALMIGVLALVFSIPLAGVASAHGTTKGTHQVTYSTTHPVAHQQIYVAHLSGDQQVLPVFTDAQGVAISWLSPDGKQLHYYLLVTNLKNATMAHIHLSKAGQNGAVVLLLFHSMTPISTTGAGDWYGHRVTTGRAARRSSAFRSAGKDGGRGRLCERPYHAASGWGDPGPDDTGRLGSVLTGS